MAKGNSAIKKMASVPNQGMIVIGSGDRPIDEVATDLSKAGFKVDRVLKGIGQITGYAAPTLKTRLMAIRGVADVSETHQDFTIGPPDAPIS